MKTTIEKEIAEHLNVVMTMSSLIDRVEIAAQLCIDALQEGGKLIIFGNGGSAADAQHIAAELVGRYKVNRKGLSALALTTDSSALTAIGNDFGYKSLFDRQVEALANKGDVLIGISTSGKSINVINALKLGSQLQCKTIGFSGNDGGQMNKICDVNLVIPSKDTPRIQEMHIVLGHTICHLIDLEFKD